MASMRILQKIQVSPSLPSQPPQLLSFLDTIWLHNTQPVERLFFYEFPHPISHFLDNILPIFTKSLSLTLHHFYLLAGSIRNSDAGFEIAYTDGDTVPITVAEFTGEDFHNMSSNRPRYLESLKLLLPNPTSCGQVIPPISIQVTLFPSHGLSIGFAINHAVCDGSATMQFIRSWAAACRSPVPDLPTISPPLLDRSVIIDTFGIQQKIIELALKYKQLFEDYSKKHEKLPILDPDLVHATFTIPKDWILRLKERVGKTSVHISAFVVACGYVWRCLLRAKGCEGDMEEYFSFVVDWRRRMRPEIPSDYFGNCLGFCTVELKLGEILGENGIELAAIEIGKSIVGLEGKDVGELMLEMDDKAKKILESKPLSVAGSPKLRVYEIDFGWGRPVKVDVISIHDTAAISLAESREEEGGLEIGLVLPKEEMDKFVNYFSGDFNLLDISS